METGQRRKRLAAVAAVVAVAALLLGLLVPGASAEVSTSLPSTSTEVTTTEAPVSTESSSVTEALKPTTSEIAEVELTTATEAVTIIKPVEEVATVPSAARLADTEVINKAAPKAPAKLGDVGAACCLEPEPPVAPKISFEAYDCAPGATRTYTINIANSNDVDITVTSHRSVHYYAVQDDGSKVLTHRNEQHAVEVPAESDVNDTWTMRDVDVLYVARVSFDGQTIYTSEHIFNCGAELKAPQVKAASTCAGSTGAVRVDLLNPNKFRIHYEVRIGDKLENWPVPAGQTVTVHFSGLSPGDYIVKVSAHERVTEVGVRVTCSGTTTTTSPTSTTTSVTTTSTTNPTTSTTDPTATPTTSPTDPTATPTSRVTSGVVPVGNSGGGYYPPSGRLADTGVSGVRALVVVALGLVAGGLALLLVRRRATS